MQSWSAVLCWQWSLFYQLGLADFLPQETVGDVALEEISQFSESRRFTVMAVGRLIELKKPYSILKAFCMSDDRTGKLVFVGQGPLCSHLLKESRKLGVTDQVEITGWIAREQVYESLVGADLFVSASNVEGLPIAVLEAMACRCPVVLSDIPPHREIASGSDFIPLIHPDDVAGFAREIKRFRRMAALERAQIGKQCRKLVEERFSLRRMHQEYAEIYMRLQGPCGDG